MSRITRITEAVTTGIARRLPGDKGHRWALAVVAVAVVAAVTLNVAFRERSPEATVQAFFDARAAGDCDRLVGLISEDSWSQGGQLDRHDFVDQCDEIVDTYSPTLAGTTALGGHGDRAAVAVELEGMVPPLDLRNADGFVVLNDRSERTYHGTAMLTREGGSWKVVTDRELLRIGRSPNETLAAYWDARVAGDCVELAGLLTEDAWAAAGADDRDGFVEVCERDWGRPRALPAGITLPRLDFEVTGEPGEGDGVTAVADSALLTEVVIVADSPTRRISLVADGLSWRFDHDPQAMAVAALRGMSIDEAAPGYGPAAEDVVLDHEENERENAFDGLDGTPATREEAGFGQGVITQFSHPDDGYITVLLYEFDTADGATRYATHSVSAALEEPDTFPASRPTSCGRLDDCTRADGAVAVDVAGRYVVAAWASDLTDATPPAETMVTLAEEAVAHQIDQLG